MTDRVYLNGEWVATNQACVPVFDRGFLFGDGVYEVIPAFGGRLFGAKAHLARLDRSLGEIGIEPPMSHGEWQALFERAIIESGCEDVSIYIQVTRGAPDKRDHAWPRTAVRPTVFVSASPLKPLPDEIRRHGATAITVPDLRWERCDIKSVNLLPNTLARQQAVAKGAFEAILVRDGLALEGAASNLFAVIDDVLLTAPLGPHILGGITRNRLVELAQSMDGICMMEQPIPVDRLFDASEVFVTSSTKDLVPITRINDHAVGDGGVGAVWSRLDAEFQTLKQSKNDSMNEVAG